MHTKQCWLDKEQESIGGIKYCNEALSHPDIENWEKKEYEYALDIRKIKLKNTQDHIKFLKAEGLWDNMPDSVRPKTILAIGQSNKMSV